MASYSGFHEVFNNAGSLTKVRERFGRSKEVTLNAFNGGIYLHIADNSICFNAEG